MAQIWSNPDNRPIRGTIPVGKEWPYGSRQVIRRAMASMYFTQMSRFALPRRIRRAMARAKTHNIYRMVKQDQLANGVVGNLTKKESWLVSLARKAANIFKLEG